MRRAIAAMTAAVVCLATPALAADGPGVAAKRAAYEATKAQFGLESEQAVAREIDLANALLADDQMKEGVDRLGHVRAYFVGKGGPDAPEGLIISAGLAIVLVNSGDPAQGEAVARDALERALRTRGEADIVTGMAKAGLGAALSLRGRYTEAYPLLQDGYASMGAAFAPGSLEVRQIGAMLQNVSAALGHDAEALALRRKLAEPPPEGAPEPLVLLAAGQQLFLLNAEGRHGEAIDLGEALVARLTAQRGAGHTSTLEAMGALANAHAGLARWDEASAILQKVYEGYAKVRGPEDLMTLRWSEALGLYQTRSSVLATRAAGRARLTRIIEIRRRLTGPHAPQVVLTEVTLGMSALQDADLDPKAALDESFRWLLEADRDLAADPAQADSLTALAVNVLIGAQLINQGDAQPAYDRLSHAASVIRARSADRRVATSGQDATGLLTQYRYIFTNQVRAGWMLAHQP